MKEGSITLVKLFAVNLGRAEKRLTPLLRSHSDDFMMKKTLTDHNNNKGKFLSFLVAFFKQL